MYFAGIGSRETPTNILQTMTRIAESLVNSGFVLRSGGAPGADSAFEQGCSRESQKQIFLPWKSFNGNCSTLYPPFKLASIIHPVYNKLSTKAQTLIARNMHQILGIGLDDPVDFVVCWTQDGCESEKTYSIKTGGTGSAIVLASRLDIPVYNLSNAGSFSYVVNVLLKEARGI